MTAAQIQEALMQAAPHDRIRLAAQLIANACMEDELLEPTASIPDDPAVLISHLRTKLSR
jgi:hypothetical protein